MFTVIYLTVFERLICLDVQKSHRSRVADHFIVRYIILSSISSQVQHLGQHRPLHRKRGCPAASQEQNPPPQQQALDCFQPQPEPAGQWTAGPGTGQREPGRRPPGHRRPGRAVQPDVHPRHPEDLWERHLSGDELQECVGHHSVQRKGAGEGGTGQVSNEI